jgi:hypothetical protein
MSTGSWPLDLFWQLSGLTLIFALGAYVVGQVRQQRPQQRE